MKLTMIDEIIARVAEDFKIAPAQLTGGQRGQQVSDARHICMLLLYMLGEYYHDIAVLFGISIDGVRYGIKAARNLTTTNEIANLKYQKLFAEALKKYFSVSS